MLSKPQHEVADSTLYDYAHQRAEVLISSMPEDDIAESLWTKELLAKTLNSILGAHAQAEAKEVYAQFYNYNSENYNDRIVLVVSAIGCTEEAEMLINSINIRLSEDIYKTQLVKSGVLKELKGHYAFAAYNNKEDFLKRSESDAAGLARRGHEPPTTPLQIYPLE